MVSVCELDIDVDSTSISSSQFNDNFEKRVKDVFIGADLLSAYRDDLNDFKYVTAIMYPQIRNYKQSYVMSNSSRIQQNHT